MALRVQLACWHLLWPAGDPSLYKEGEEAYCGTCKGRRLITSIGQVATC